MREFSFFDIPEPVKLGDIAAYAGCTLLKPEDAEKTISTIGPLENSPVDSLSFLDNAKYVSALEGTKAAAIICPEKYVAKIPHGITVLVSPTPYRSFALAMGMMFPKALYPTTITGESGISSGAFVHPDAQIEEDVTVEFGAVVGAGASIGSGSLIGANAVIGPGVQIGRNTAICCGATVICALVGNDVIIHPGVRIGQDGFGFSMGPGGHLKVPQIGRVIIQDKVEIGANTTIDRGANRDTIIGEGTKIDNQVVIGHNVIVGCHCVLVAQVGLAGSATLGNYVVLGARAGVIGHMKVGDGAQIAGNSAVADNVPPGVQWGGVPARPIKHWLKELATARAGARKMAKGKK
jgi:UDP-3-O-[3-hydroxymyristoyl] glucosamine N-acyltransferase